MCVKLYFVSRKLAKRALKSFNKESQGLRSKLTNVYWCSKCEFWHITSMNKKKSRAITRYRKNTSIKKTTTDDRRTAE